MQAQGGRGVVRCVGDASPRLPHDAGWMVHILWPCACALSDDMVRS